MKIMNRVALSGNICHEVNIKGEGEKAIATVTIAVKRSKEETDFIDCVAFGKVAENLYLLAEKGKRILIEGNLRISVYKNKEGKNVKKATVNITSFEV